MPTIKICCAPHYFFGPGISSRPVHMQSRHWPKDFQDVAADLPNLRPRADSIKRLLRQAVMQEPTSP
jgi:hypothetical protein